jgi:hypothetical protein
MATHEFKCPDCGRSCLLKQDPVAKQSSIQHALPTCNTYDRTKSDGQKFLELAFAARPVSDSMLLVKP